MAEVNMSFVVDRILETLGSAEVKESAKIWNVADKFKDLELKISTLRSFLLQEDQLQRLRQEVKQQLEMAVYETDEFVDACLALALGRTRQSTQAVLTEVKNFFTTSSDRFAFQFKMIKKLRQVLKKLDEVFSSEVISEYRKNELNTTLGGSQTIESERDSSCLLDVKNPEDDVIGRDFDIWRIMDLVLEQHYHHHADIAATATAAATSELQKIKVVPVVGAQGIGKTTLAKVVYNEAKIKQRFDLRMWVSISDLVDEAFIVQNLIRFAKSGDKTSVDGLQQSFQQAIEGNTFLLVLDGVRDKDQPLWLGLRNWLTVGATAKEGSTVLVTTRSETVAMITGTAAGSHHLGPMDDEDSWPLLKREAFRGKDQEQLVAGAGVQKLEEIARQIADKCLGVPFVILEAGKLLCVLETSKWELSSADNIIAKARKVQKTNIATEERVFGRRRDKEAIMKQLLEHNSEQDIFVIHGTKGVGKTLLAQLICNDSQVQNHFDLRIWVSVSNELDLKVVMEKILVSVTSTTNPSGERLQADELKNRIRQETLRRRYLLILDDVWNLHNRNWSDLEGLLDVGAKGSRVVVTTSTKEVATSTNPRLRTHLLKPLDKDDSWSLFVKVAFEDGLEPTNSNILEIAKEIVSRCGGIPLHIRRIGGILYGRSEAEWSSFLDNNKDLKMMLEDADVPESVRLSYDHLPYFLRPCIIYCSLFPDDYEIDVQTLVNLWISQGFLRTSSDSNLEDVGYRFCEDLVRRSFFKEIVRDDLGRIAKCKKENFVNDLTMSKALNAYATLGMNGVMNVKGKTNGKEARHVSCNFHLDSSWHFHPLAQSEKNIQTLILPTQSRWEVEGRSSEAVCEEVTKFKYLRTLDLHNSGIKDVSYSIGDLRHLRYLDLSHNVNIRALPKSIGMLRNLQTLKLNHCGNLQKLPTSIKNLANLRNLENKSCYSLTKIPRGFGQLIKLRTLSEFVLCKDKKSGQLQELEKLDELRGKLKIKNLGCLGDDDATRAKLTAKKHLVSLELIWDVEATFDDVVWEKLLEDLQPHEDLRELSLFAYGGDKFSSWLPRHSKLVKFSLSGCMKCRCLPPLYHLPCLEVLLVDDLPNLKYVISEGTSGDKSYSSEAEFFKSLKELQLTNLPELMRWWQDAENGSPFHRLSKLIIEDCPKLTSMPAFPVLEEVLVLKNTKWNPLEETIAAVGQLSKLRTIAAFGPLSKLRTLCIINMSNANGGGPNNMFQSLPSLRSLKIDHVPDIKPFIEGLKLLTNLQELHIWRCATLEGISWIKDIKSLRILSIKLCPELNIPRKEIHLIHSLQDAVIQECPKVSHIGRMLEDDLYKTS